MMKLREHYGVDYFRMPTNECEKITKSIVDDFLERNPNIAANPETISNEDVKALDVHFQLLRELLKESNAHWSDIPHPPLKLIRCTLGMYSCKLVRVAQYAVWEYSLYEFGMIFHVQNNWKFFRRFAR